MTEPDDPQYDWDTYVSSVYAEVIGEADHAEGTTTQEAMSTALERILEAIDRGDVKPDMADVIKRALKHADEVCGKRGDKLIADTVHGRLTLFDCDEDLNCPVVLGGGRRKLWRYVDGADLEAMDSLRYANFRNQQNAYNKWRELFETARPVVRTHGDVEHAIGSGAFNDEAQ